MLDTTYSGGNHTFTVDNLDGDLANPKQDDRYAIGVRDSGAVVMQLGSSTSLLQLGGGNVLIQR